MNHESNFCFVLIAVSHIIMLDIALRFLYTNWATMGIRPAPHFTDPQSNKLFKLRAQSKGTRSGGNVGWKYFFLRGNAWKMHGLLRLTLLLRASKWPNSSFQVRRNPPGIHPDLHPPRSAPENVAFIVVVAGGLYALSINPNYACTLHKHKGSFRASPFVVSG